MIKVYSKPYDMVRNSLYLTNMNLTYIPDEVFKLENLEILCLSNNRIHEIPTNIHKLKKLKMLYLDNNNITNIPMEIFNILSLEVLILSENNIHEIPLGITQLVNLKQIWLYKNKISILPVELASLKKLTGLYMNDNNISHIPREYGMLTNMEALVFDKNLICDIPYELISCSKLKMLYLRYNPISVTDNRIVNMIVDKIHNRPNKNINILQNISMLDNIEQDVNGTCIVCYSSNDEPDIKLLKLSCHETHIICSECIGSLHNKICPCCRTDIVMNNII